jgi:hypothetical protein
MLSRLEFQKADKQAKTEYHAYEGATAALICGSDEFGDDAGEPTSVVVFIGGVCADE